MSEPQTSEPRVTITDSQVGVVGDHAHVEGGIHFDQKGQQVDSQINVAGNYYDQRVYHTAPPANLRERRNRAAMLQLVRNTWIKGLLEQSLHGAALIELGLEYRPDAVDHPWDMVVQMPERPDRQLPPGTLIVEVFDESGGSLLILGEPGSGKTTMLLELARNLIARAEQDETLHIPVVFNLFSWAVKQQKLEEWLIEELRTKYHIPQKVAQGWLENDTLLLLLDGLDEVKADAREKCLDVINAFRERHLVPLAVCSRTANYAALTAKLHIHTAIYLHPLTSAQIDTYLAGAGTELRAIQATLQHDLVLREMAESPLFLSVMALAYRGKNVADLRVLSTSEARRQHLFDTYIEQMLQYRAEDRRNVPEQTLHWLTWLAQKMQKYSITTFYIIHPQPYWLPATISRCVQGAAFLATGLCFAFSGILFGTLAGFIHYGQWVFGLFFALIGAVVGLVLSLLGSTPDTINLYATNTYSWLEPRNGLVVGLPHELMGTSFLWLMIVLVFELILYIGMRFSGEPIRELGIWLSIGLHIWLILSVLNWGRGARMIILYHTLRYFLALTNRAPRNYPRFLDYCSERVLLHKVGGGYIFIHRLLMEHFASLTPEDIERIAADVEGARA